jgi:sugar phosphate isomerase/epimerase
MHLGIFAKTFPRPTLEETLDVLVERGFYHVQFNLSCVGLPTLPDRLEPDHCIWIARSFRQRGITMAAISGTFNLCDPESDRLRENLHRLEVLAAACRWLDTRIITLCTGTLDSEDMWRWHPGNVRRSTWSSLVDSMRQALAIADRHEVTLAFEPEIHNVVNSVSKARRLLDEIDSPWLKVLIDPANLIGPGQLPRSREVLDEAFDWLGSDLVLAHAKNPRPDETSRENLDIPVPADSATFWDLLRELQEEILWEKVLIAARENMPPAMQEKMEERSESQGGGLSQIFRFYYYFFTGLKQIGYDGAIVLHGLPESEASSMSDFLTWLLRCIDRTP